MMSQSGCCQQDLKMLDRMTDATRKSTKRSFLLNQALLQIAVLAKMLTTSLLDEVSH